VSLIFLVGLTGAGKSTVLPVLLAGGARRELPDRRSLTDSVIIPAALRLDGFRSREVADRLERFRLTARYREEHPDGIVHALAEHLADEEHADQAVFDGVRGLAEVAAADRRFPGSRFLMLEALPETRVRRIAGRADAFDRRAGPEDQDLLRARRIVDEEQRHYDQSAARRYLEDLPARRRLIVETDAISAAEVAAVVKAWL
jgi:hypothetical protein